MRIISFLIVSFCVSMWLSPKKFDIIGTIKDTLGQPLIAATVMLMDKDSLLLEYTQTDLKGSV
ncbi:MAG: hypothetical protein IPO48_07165 [Saprospiraceae bacterium]|nr:hypothetical protein [Saprospiraceae bacterium]